jgi:small subunit ribosomal protein S16
MPVKIRLQRHGKKGKPFYWIVAADSRAKRDGKFLEKLGTYNPNTNPATIDVDVDGSVQWLNNGAQPTNTARAILSYKGVLLKHHLLGGVRKGALTEEQAEEKFQAWVSEKEAAVQAKKDGLSKEQADAKAKALEAEKEFSDKRAAAALPELEEAAEEVIEESAPVVEEATETPEAEVAGDAKEEIAAVEAAPEVPKEAPAAPEMKEDTPEAGKEEK